MSDRNSSRRRGEDRPSSLGQRRRRSYDGDSKWKLGREEHSPPAKSRTSREADYHDDHHSRPSRLERKEEDYKSHDRRREDYDESYKSRKGRSRSPRERPSHRRRNSSDDGGRRRRSRDPRDDHPPRSRNKASSRSPPRRRHSPPPPTPAPYKRSGGPLPSQESAYKGGDTAPIALPEKQKPNFASSGKLAAETNTVAGTAIVLKYNEPPEARKPPASHAWRMYVFKGKETLETIELGTRSCWLFGRERAVADFPVDHPSCSKQHAVLQFRFVDKKNEFGDRIGGVKPYVIDLESANGTKVNGDKIPEKRFVEVLSGDVLGFGDSTREYVLMLPPEG